MTTIDISHIARIEGHGSVEVKLKDGKIEDITLKTVEPARFFESFVGGRHFNDLALIVSRICGICSPNHTISGLMAVEDALGLGVSKRTRMLRQLLVHGSFIQNHTTHLYLLAAPDYLNAPSVLPLKESNPAVLERALALKKLGNDLCTAVGGRPVHPVNAVVGGFTDEPDSMTLQILAARLRAALKDALQTVDLFAKMDIPDFQPEREKLALHTVSGAANGYAILSDSSSTEVVRASSLTTASKTPKEGKSVKDYHDFIKEQTHPEAGNAKFSYVEDASGNSVPFMVGALARITINWDNLMPAAAGAIEAVAKSTGFKRGESNPHFNNLCQAIEIADALQRCAVLCDKLAASYPKQQGQIKPPKHIDLQQGTGFSASEAPRGTLYYSIGLNEQGYVTSGDVITPTAQNLASIEADLQLLAPQLEGLAQEELMLRIKQLIRAYDPCLSCAVH